MTPDLPALVCHVLGHEIRPLLKVHGGGVRMLGVSEDGVVELAFEGACRGCALQSATYAVGIRRRLLELPGVSAVTMRGVRVSNIALKRIASLYKNHPFRVASNGVRGPFSERVHAQNSM